MEATSPRGTRRIPAAEFFTGLWSTALEADEILVGTYFPVWSGRRGFAVQEFARRHGDFAIAGAAVAVELGGDDRVQRCAIGLLGRSAEPTSELPSLTRTSYAAFCLKQIKQYASILLTY